MFNKYPRLQYVSNTLLYSTVHNCTCYWVRVIDRPVMDVRISRISDVLYCMLRRFKLYLKRNYIICEETMRR